MSQSNGLLTEDEIRAYFNEALGLKLEREAFIRPTSQAVIDIYTRFLEDTHYPWRKVPPHMEPPDIKFLLVRGLRYILSRYQTNFTFHMGDLIAPTRKRLIAFLNILIFWRAQREDKRAWWEEKKNERQVESLELINLDKALAANRLERDELAIMLANYPHINELRKENDLLTSQFEAVKAECEQINGEKKRIKIKLDEINKSNAQMEAERKHLEDVNKRLKQTLTALNDGPKIKTRCLELEQAIKRETEQLNMLKMEIEKLKDETIKLEQIINRCELNNQQLFHIIVDTKSKFKEEREKLNKIEKDIEETKLSIDRNETREVELQDQLESLISERDKMRKKYKIKIETSRLNLEEKIAAKQKIAMAINEEINLLRSQQEEVLKQQEDVKLKRSQFAELYENEIERVNRSYANFEKPFLEISRNHRENLRTLAGHQCQVDVLLNGRQTIITTSKETTVLDLPAANRTYTKGTA